MVVMVTVMMLMMMMMMMVMVVYFLTRLRIASMSAADRSFNTFLT